MEDIDGTEQKNLYTHLRGLWKEFRERENDKGLKLSADLQSFDH